jgi:mono/diheme cytochrome c family protein
MNKVRLFALTTVVCLAACGTDKSAASDTAAAVPPPQPSPAVTPAPAADSMVVAPAGKASIPSKAPVPTTRTATATAAAPAPVAAKPAAPSPAAQPAAPAPAAAKPAAPAPVVSTAPDPSLGAPLYDANCKKCHGAVGIPVKVMQTKFPKMMPMNAAFFAKNTDDAVVDILMNGKGTDMKSFKDKLSHAEMGSVAAYIRTLPSKQ